MSRLWKAVVEFVFPPRCLCCEDFVRNGQWSFICHGCLQNINPVPLQACARCGSPIPEGRVGKAVCLSCSAMGRHAGKLFAVSPFDGPMSVLIRQFKFRGHTEVAALGGQLLAAALQRAKGDEEYDLLVPVPLHIRRLRQRGFNQSLLLAREVGRITGIAVARDALSRHRWTMPQLGLDEKSRRENVRGAFGVTDPACIMNKRILLIDDVFTTGCTANECAVTLMAAGARAVDVMTLARVV